MVEVGVEVLDGEEADGGAFAKLGHLADPDAAEREVEHDELGDALLAQDVAHAVEGAEHGIRRAVGGFRLRSDEADSAQADETFLGKPRLELRGLFDGASEGDAFLAVAGERPLAERARDEIVGEEQREVKPGDVAEEKAARELRVLEREHDEEDPEQAEERLAETLAHGGDPGVQAAEGFVLAAPTEQEADEEKFVVEQVTVEGARLGKQGGLPDEQPGPVADRDQQKLAEEGQGADADGTIADHIKTSTWGVRPVTARRRRMMRACS